MTSPIARRTVASLGGIDDPANTESGEALPGKSRREKKFLNNTSDYLSRIADLHRFSLFRSSSQLTPKFYTTAQDSYVSGVVMALSRQFASDLGYICNKNPSAINYTPFYPCWTHPEISRPQASEDLLNSMHEERHKTAESHRSWDIQMADLLITCSQEAYTQHLQSHISYLFIPGSAVWMAAFRTYSHAVLDSFSEIVDGQIETLIPLPAGGSSSNPASAEDRESSEQGRVSVLQQMKVRLGLVLFANVFPAPLFSIGTRATPLQWPIPCPILLLDVMNACMVHKRGFLLIAGIINPAAFLVHSASVRATGKLPFTDATSSIYHSLTSLHKLDVNRSWEAFYEILGVILERLGLALPFVETYSWDIPSPVEHNESLKAFHSKFTKDVKEGPVDFGKLHGMQPLIEAIQLGADLKAMIPHCSLTKGYLFGGETNLQRQAITKYATLLGWAHLLHDSSFQQHTSFQQHILSAPWVVNLFYKLNETISKYIKNFRFWFTSIQNMLPAPNSQPDDVDSEPSLLIPTEEQLHLVTLVRQEQVRLHQVAKTITDIGDILEKNIGIEFRQLTTRADANEIGIPAPINAAYLALQSAVADHGMRMAARYNRTWCSGPSRLDNYGEVLIKGRLTALPEADVDAFLTRFHVPPRFEVPKRALMEELNKTFVPADFDTLFPRNRLTEDDEKHRQAALEIAAQEEARALRAAEMIAGSKMKRKSEPVEETLNDSPRPAKRNRTAKVKRDVESEP